MRSNRRSLALALAAAMAAPLGCNQNSAPPPPVDDTRSGSIGREAPAPGSYEARDTPAPDRPHMSTKKKVVILAGAAALYYLYKHHKTATQQHGAEGQYYLSKNGRVYYRDADHRAHWVTPPAGGIQVPESEATEYQQFQGYDGQPTGRDLTGLAADSESPPF